MNRLVRFNLLLLLMAAPFCIESCDLLGPLETTDTTVPEVEFKPGRWAFITEPGEDAKRKKVTLKKIDQFWASFKANKEKLAWSKSLDADHSFQTDWLSQHVHSFDSRLEWECGGNADGESDLDISAAENSELMPLLTTIIERAGTIPGWHISCFRQPMQSDLVETAYKARRREPMPSYRASVSRNKFNGIDVLIDSPEFVGNNRKEDIAKAFLITEIVLGEEDAEKWATNVTTSSTENFSKRKFDSEAEAKNFAKSFSEQKLAIKASLPSKHYWQIDYPEKVILISATKEAFKESNQLDRSRLTFISPDEKLAFALADHFRFFSEHFSNHNEKFAYLHVITKDAAKWERDRGEIEDALDKFLKTNKSGAVVASGRGKPESFYFDLCLTDVESAIPLLKKFCRERKLPATTWLRFYDLYWTYEWVKMLPNSPELKNPESIW
jgi:hypothetical protein